MPFAPSVNTKLDLTLIDLNHLGRQTMDDIALQSEVLGLFHQQLLAAKGAIKAMTVDDRRDLAHCLVGAAKAVGAFSFAETMEALGHDPASRSISDRALSQIDSLILHLREELGQGRSPGG